MRPVADPDDEALIGPPLERGGGRGEEEMKGGGGGERRRGEGDEDGEGGGTSLSEERLLDSRILSHARHELSRSAGCKIVTQKVTCSSRKTREMGAVSEVMTTVAPATSSARSLYSRLTRQGCFTSDTSMAHRRSAPANDRRVRARCARRVHGPCCTWCGCPSPLKETVRNRS